MTSIKPSRSRTRHIDGLKGILCFMIMLGHFWHMYRDIPDGAVLASPLLVAIRDFYPARVLLSEGFWLYAFFIISGWLLSSARVENLRALALRSVKRFLRMFIPVAGACLFIFLIQQTVGFHNAATRDYFTSAWFQSYYPRSLGWEQLLADPLRTMFFASSRFNSPFWVIRDMLLSSILIYTSNYVCRKWPKTACFFPWLLLILSLVCPVSRVIPACLTGYQLGRSREALKAGRRSATVFIAFAVAVPAGCMLMLYLKILPGSVSDVLLNSLIHCLLIAAVNRFAPLQKLLSAKPFLLMGKFNFGVYALHWPVICSAGSLALIAGIRRQWAPEWILLASLLASVALTLLLAVIYHFTVERAADAVLRRIR